MFTGLLPQGPNQGRGEVFDATWNGFFFSIQNSIFLKKMTEVPISANIFLHILFIYCSFNNRTSEKAVGRDKRFMPRVPCTMLCSDNFYEWCFRSYKIPWVFLFSFSSLSLGYGFQLPWIQTPSQWISISTARHLKQRSMGFHLQVTFAPLHAVWASPASLRQKVSTDTGWPSHQRAKLSIPAGRSASLNCW